MKILLKRNQMPKKTDDEILEEAVQSIQNSKQSLSESKNLLSEVSMIEVDAGLLHSRRKNPPSFIVLHHTTTSSPQKTLNTWPPRGTRRASTHYEIDTDGTIYQYLDPATKVAWHTAMKGVNGNSIGIDLTGNFYKKAPPSENDPQIRATRALITSLSSQFGIPLKVYTGKERISPGIAMANGYGITKHKNFGATGCPGNLPFHLFGEPSEEIIDTEVGAPPTGRPPAGGERRGRRLAGGRPGSGHVRVRGIRSRRGPDITPGVGTPQHALAANAQRDLDVAIEAYNTAQNKTERENADAAIQKFRKIITNIGFTPGSVAPAVAAVATAAATQPTTAPAVVPAAATAPTMAAAEKPKPPKPKCQYDPTLSHDEAQYKLDVCLASKRAAARAALEEIVSLITGPSEKTDDKILEEAVQLIQKSKQLINEDWASRWLPRWLGGGSNETPDWIPNILGKGSLIAPGEGISLKDREQYISPEMMAAIQRNNPDLDLSTREGFEDAMRQGGMTGEQAKAETEEYFETGMAGVETAAALATLYAMAPAAAAAPAAGEAGVVATGTTLRTGGGAALRTSPFAPAITTAQRSAIQRAGMLTNNLKKPPSWGRKVLNKIWGPTAKKWYGRYVWAELAAFELAPQLYDRVLKYIDPIHYATATAQSLHLAPWLVGESKPSWVDNFFGRDPEYGSMLGLGEWFEPYMPWYEENYIKRTDLRDELVSATAALKTEMEKCGGKAPCPKAEEANKKRIAVIENMKAQSAEEYSEWIKIAEEEGVSLGELGDHKKGAGEAAPEAAVSEEPTTHGPENPAVYAYGTEAEKAHYEQLKQSSEGAAAQEFLNHYIYGGEEGEE